MHDMRQRPLAAFALYVLKPVWIGGKPTHEATQSSVSWSGLGPHDVPIHARRDGFIIFEFDKSPAYCGGAIPSYVPRPKTRIPGPVLEAAEARKTLAYRRFRYMNAFLAGLYSGWSTIQKAAISVQTPINPTEYFVAVRDGGHWGIYGDLGGNVEYPQDRRLLEVETVAHATALMVSCHRTFAGQSIELLNLVYLACHQYSHHQFQSAHVLAWTVIEMQLNAMWSHLLKRSMCGRAALRRSPRPAEVDLSRAGNTHPQLCLRFYR